MNVGLLARSTRLVTVATMVLMLSPATKAQDSKYEAVGGWAHLPAGMHWEAVTSASTDGDGNVYVFRRSEPPILKFDKNRSYVRSLADGIIASAHGIRVDS